MGIDGPAHVSLSDMAPSVAPLGRADRVTAPARLLARHRTAHEEVFHTPTPAPPHEALPWAWRRGPSRSCAVFRCDRRESQEDSVGAY